jgi:hypothetical protein
MSAFAIKYKTYFCHKEYVRAVVSGVIFLFASFVVNFYAGLYATESASSSVTDIVLSNTRVYDVDGIFVYGPIMFWWFVAVWCFFEPQKIPFTLKSIALFVVIRSVFVSMTHMGPFPSQVTIDPASIINLFSFGGDLFFSAHTGLPFLMALVFWDDVRLRLFFTFCAVLFGVVVLLSHLHYTIDVLSAFFITYAIFHIAEYLFPRDRKLFKAGLQ